MKRPILFLAACLALAACGNRISGTWVSHNSMLDKIEFVSGSKVDVSFMGQTKEGTYRFEGDKLVITIAGDDQVFHLTRTGCIDGGPTVGTFCKEA